MSRSMYPTDEAGRALLWRHRQVMHALEHGDLVYGELEREDGSVVTFVPEDAVFLVLSGRLNGNDELLERSLAAIREKAAA